MVIHNILACTTCIRILIEIKKQPEIAKITIAMVTSQLHADSLTVKIQLLRISDLFFLKRAPHSGSVDISSSESGERGREIRVVRIALGHFGDLQRPPNVQCRILRMKRAF